MECFYSNNNGNLLVKKNIFTDINILKLTCTNTIKILATICKLKKNESARKTNRNEGKMNLMHLLQFT